MSVEYAMTPEDWRKHLALVAGNKRGGESEVGLGVYAYHSPEEPENGVTESIPAERLARPLLVMQWDSATRVEIIHDPHQLAAICLHGQPFGFSHEDLKLLDRVSAQLSQHAETWHNSEDLTDPFACFARKIAVLLPPIQP